MSNCVLNCFVGHTRMPASMPLYNVLNEFQKGSSHMAAVTRDPKVEPQPPPTDEEVEKGGGSNHGAASFLDAMIDMVKQHTGQGGGSGSGSGHNSFSWRDSKEASKGGTEQTEIKVEGDGDPLAGLEGLGGELSEREIEKEVRAGNDRKGHDKEDLERGLLEGARELEAEEEEREKRRGHRQSTEKGWREEEPEGDADIVGIITMEDVIEELLQVAIDADPWIDPLIKSDEINHDQSIESSSSPLRSPPSASWSTIDDASPFGGVQEEIVDETDEYIDVHKK